MPTPRTSRRSGARLGLDATTSDPADIVAGDTLDLPTLIAAMTRGRPAWTDSAACRGSSLDFTSKSPAVIAACIQVCGQCPARLECRAFADEIEDRFAVLGGEDASARIARWRVRGRTVKADPL